MPEARGKADRSPPALEQVRQRLAEISDLDAALSLLHWDQATYMPQRAAEARGHQLAALSTIAHQRRTDSELGRVLDQCHSERMDLDLTSETACLIRVAREDYERLARIPAAFAAQHARHAAHCYDTWAKARPAGDFALVAPLLETTLELSRELASFYPGHAHVADPLIERADPGVTVAQLRRLFSELRALLVPLVAAIREQEQPDCALFRHSFDEDAQLAFGASLLRDIGYDFERGRQDRTLHPFMSRFAANDVRITTRIKETDLGEALFSSLHEGGHALYELGIAQSLDRTPLACGASAGLHESQSRLWENLVCRSFPFWEHYFPRLREAFPQLAGRSAQEFYRAINRVAPSLIRTDADEVTYNLHIIIRFDLELALLEGELAVRDLPEAWNERYRTDLGVSPPDDRDGVLQDVHWYADLIGGQFQCYAIGNVLAAQLFEAAQRDAPEIEGEIGRGEFGALRAWLGTNIHRHGRMFPSEALVERATGEPLGVAAYRRYLYRKFGELYALPE